MPGFALRKRGHLFLVAAMGTLAVSSAVQAGDVTYTFDNLPVNTAVTNQYDGVTFSVHPQSCGGSPTISMRIKAPNGGTSSGAYGLGIDTGCPDFSPDYLRMVFDSAQSRVSFTLGDAPGTYRVRAYSTVGDDTGLLSTQNIVISGSGFVGVHRLVSVSSASGNIRRIDVQELVGLWETIDDLTFDIDSTPPVADINTPLANHCGCGTVLITGTADDPDGTYNRDWAEYRPAASDAWTLIGEASTPVTNDDLYFWNVSALSEGLYFIRLTVENDGGGRSTAVTSLWVSQNFDTVNFSVPPVVGGSVCPDGTVFDNWCDTESYAVEYSVVGSGTWNPVEAGVPTYPGSKLNEPLATWNTLSPPIADGNYLVRVRGENPCADTRTVVSGIIVVDNTPPIALITQPEACSTPGSPTSIEIRGTATDSHLESWSLWYTGGDASGWVPITASSATPVVNGVLGTWNTAGLRPCAYTLRLVVNDQAVVNCNSAISNTNEHTVSVDLGCRGDFNRDGSRDVPDVFAFLSAWFAGCP